MSNINSILTKTANERPAVLTQSYSVQDTGFTNALSQKLNVPSSMDSIFKEAASTYQVPENLLKAVAKAESNFNAKAVSKAGAQGVMQLMPATAKSLGVTNSFDARQNIMGGAKYLSSMLKKYDGNVKLALAAYNAGSGNVDKYNGVPPFKETQNYVVKVMKYADSKETLSVPPSSNSAAGSVNSYYENIVKNMLSFDNYTTDDYLLFLEILKNNLNTSDLLSSSDAVDNMLQSSLYSSRIQTLY